MFRKQKYYSASEGKTYLASLPLGYEGEFGPGIKALVMSLYYGGNMTQSKMKEFLEDIGISVSAGYLSNLLIKNSSAFEVEFKEVYIEGLASSPCLEKLRAGGTPARNFSLATFRPNRCACWWSKPYNERNLQSFVYCLPDHSKQRSLKRTQGVAKHK
ncbi:hypothetical protein [Brunnivagina elsteri]|uniref:Transposase n=1 Tax=Brunnivagina elsteri CCALA 953 TaxID=987040 RepID=A0A2A2TC59_9CYAN|nr:hypothetical protein [Calothrix elsteri]PAX51312.1 hypothetical protein CK510_25465 [Calothrix elsteri CCALA 953]